MNGKPKASRDSIMDSVVQRNKSSEDQALRSREELEVIIEEQARRLETLERQRDASVRLAGTGQIAAGVAHEINNPLTGIRNALFLLREAVSPNHPDYPYIGMVEREIDRIAWMVRQMRNLCLPDCVSPKEIPVMEALHEVAALLDSSCRAHQVRIDVSSTSEPLRVDLPENVMRQLLYSLLQNAVEASPRGGVVKVEASVTENILTIGVSDQGRGIPEKARCRIFEPFFTTKGKMSWTGWGLGLAMCRNIVESLDGSIHFHTETDKGTVFYVSLPLGQPGG